MENPAPETKEADTVFDAADLVVLVDVDGGYQWSVSDRWSAYRDRQGVVGMLRVIADDIEGIAALKEEK